MRVRPFFAVSLLLAVLVLVWTTIARTALGETERGLTSVLGTTDSQAEGNLKLTSRPRPDAPPFTATDGIRYVVYRATENDRAGDEVDEGYGGEDSEARFSVPAGRYVVAAAKDLARGETIVEVPERGLTVADIVVPARLISARVMATETLPIVSDDTLWEVVDAYGRVEQVAGPTLAIALPPGKARVTATLGSATATVSVDATAERSTELDVVIGAATLSLSGKRSSGARENDEDIRWDVTNAAGETVSGYGRTTFYLAAGNYRIKATLGLVAAYADVSLTAGQRLAKEFVVPTGRVVARALFARDGPATTDDVRFDLLADDPGADGQRRVLATGFENGSTFDLPPANYVVRATSDAASAETSVEVEAGTAVDAEVVLDAGVLLLRTAGEGRFEVLSGREDIYGNHPLVAERDGNEARFVLPAAIYQVKVKRRDGDERAATAMVVAGERTELTLD